MGTGSLEKAKEGKKKEKKKHMGRVSNFLSRGGRIMTIFGSVTTGAFGREFLSHCCKGTKKKVKCTLVQALR